MNTGYLSIHLYQKCFIVFSIQSFASLVKFIPQYFILFDAIVYGIVFLFSFQIVYYKYVEIQLNFKG